MTEHRNPEDDRPVEQYGEAPDIERRSDEAPPTSAHPEGEDPTPPDVAIDVEDGSVPDPDLDPDA